MSFGGGMEDPIVARRFHRGPGWEHGPAREATDCFDVSDAKYSDIFVRVSSVVEL